MNKISVFVLVLLCPIIILFSCHKPEKKETSSCTPVMYGYAHIVSGMFLPEVSCNAGIINTATVGLTSIAGMTTGTYSNQGAFNTADNSYYVFKTAMGSGYSSGKLFRIGAAGSVDSLTGYTPYLYHSLTYNAANNKLYCLRYDTITELCVVTVSGSSCTITPVATTIHTSFTGWNGTNTTADNNTGNVYFMTRDTTYCYVERYVPSTGSVSVVATIAGAMQVLGLRFNKNDNMLYGMKQLNPAVYPYNCEMIKINPATGVIATLASAPLFINSEFYSACIDPCNDKYILSSLQASTGVGWDTGVIYQFNMSGAVLQHDYTPYFYQGLDFKY